MHHVQHAPHASTVAVKDGQHERPVTGAAEYRYVVLVCRDRHAAGVLVPSHL